MFQLEMLACYIISSHDLPDLISSSGEKEMRETERCEKMKFLQASSTHNEV